MDFRLNSSKSNINSTKGAKSDSINSNEAIFGHQRHLHPDHPASSGHSHQDDGPSSLTQGPLTTPSQLAQNKIAS